MNVVSDFLINFFLGWRKRLLVIMILMWVFQLTIVESTAQDRCGTVAYTNLLQQDNLIRENEKKFEQWIGRRLENQHAFSAARAAYKIPVVFHIIHNGEAVGNGTNLSESQILSQLKVLNNDFRRINADTAQTPDEFSNRAGKMNVEFVLAKQSPTGAPTNAILRVEGFKSQWSMSDNRRLKALSYWPAEDYLNIWITDLTSSLLGYAQFPVSNLPGLEDAERNRLTDGVVLDYRIIGSNQDGSFNLTSNFNRGRTATHEVGHFLGLRHIWGDDEGACSGSGDYVDDTPNQGSYSEGCPSHPQISCNGRTMFQNYMDYTNDVCMNLYTKEQVERMLAVLDNSPRRSSLLVSHGLYDPAPVANDLTLSEIVRPLAHECIGAVTPTVVLRNNGSNRVTTAKIKLTINDTIVETIDKSFSLDPQDETEISFGSNAMTTGNWRFHFEIVQTNRLQDGKPSDNSQFVDSEVPHIIQTPFLEGFSILPSTWKRTSNGETTWDIATAGRGGSSNNALQMKFFQSEDDESELDIITTPTIDLSAATSPFVAFDVAYGKFQNHADGLEVYVISDCSNDVRNGKLIYTKYGSQLATVASTTTSFLPTNENHWRHEVLDLREFVGKTNVQVAFVAINDNGNNLYLDNISVRTDISENVSIRRLVSPAPVHCNTEITPELLVENKGNLPVEHLTVSYSANDGVAQQSFYQDLNVGPGQEVVITLPVVNLRDGNNSLAFKILYPNGFHDVDSTDNAMTIKSIVNNDQDKIPLRKQLDGDDMESTWQTINPTGSISWQMSLTNYGQSFSFSPNNATNSQDYAWLVSPVLDFSNAVTASLFFDLSYRFEGMDSSKDAPNDIFQVLLSRDCGESFDEILFNSEGDMTAEKSREGSGPMSIEDWKTFYLNLNTLAGAQNIRVAFVVSSALVHPLYLDNIEFFTSDDPSPDIISTMYAIYPNRIEAENSFYLTFNLPSRQPVSYELIDMLGRRVGFQALDDVLNQTYKVDVSSASSGAYLVRVRIDDKYFVSRLIVSR